MKKIVCISIVLIFSVASAFAQGDYAREWEEIDSLLKQQLPQSAEKIIDDIYREALAQNNVAQLVKSHLYRASALNMREEESLVRRIIKTEEAILKSSFPAQNVLHSIAAEFYWNYYTQNRWDILYRTTTEIIPDDMRTWDLRQLVEKCVEHYSASLLEPETLQSTAIEPFSAMLEKAVGSEKYRPTIYDFLAFRAVEFFDQNDANLVQPAESFSVDNPRYFAPAKEFTTLQIVTSDSLSFKFRALTLLQEIIDFHLNDPEPTALIDADLYRLDFVYKHSTLSDKEQVYLDALHELDAHYAAHPASTEILFRIARLYNQQGNAFDHFTNSSVQWKKQEAIDVIEQAVARFPESFGAQNCLALKDEISQPTADITADNATLPNKPFLVSLRYQNISVLHYKIIPVDFKQALAQRNNNSSISDRIDFYAGINPVHSGQWTLPGHEDYQPHNIEMALLSLTEGYYVIMASTDADFPRDSFLIEKPIWVSNLSYVRQDFDGSLTVLVLHRETGKPVSGVSAQEYFIEYNRDKRQNEIKFGNTRRSDARGLIHLRTGNNDYRRLNLYFTYVNDQYADNEYFGIFSDNSEEYNDTFTTLFIDRAIYRPGQTVYFKGIVLERKNEKVSIVTNSRQTVDLYNVNGENVSELAVRTNEFGSFTGSFVVPSTGLTGYMSLDVEPADGSIYFRVEEYKRPRFEVEFEPASGEYRLGEEMMVTGKATAYAGSAVSEAKVSYSVRREARYPLWRWWWGTVPASSSQEIKNGETVTREDGSFDISFTAVADPKIAKKDNPVFHYIVQASVSDINGETQEIRTIIPIGYQALMISTDIPEKINADEKREINITAANFKGQAQTVRGTLTISKLRDPGRILQERRWQRPDQFSMTREEFIWLFPYGVYDNEDQPSDWEKEEEVFRLSFDTGTSEIYHLPNIQQWRLGTYIAEIKTEDAFGETVENSNIFTLFSAAQSSLPAGEPIWFHVLNTTAQPGETVKILAGSAYPDVEAFYEIIGKDHKPRRNAVLLNNEQKTIEIPVTENERGNFAVQLFFVRNNRSYSASQIIQVPYDNKKLDLEFASFRDKLRPGEEEEWLITIKDKAGKAVVAELLASMYDVSLDAFVSYEWNFFPWLDNFFSLSWSWETDPAFRFLQSGTLTQRYSRASYSTRSYDRLVDAPGYALDRILYASTASNRATGINISRFGITANADQEEIQLETGASRGILEEIKEQESAPASIRSNFNETAFFYPQLRTNEKGETVIRFTVPEALTRWKMQGLAWTKDLKVGMVTKELVTQKELMIFTNPPRFFRENDTLYFSAKLSNISEHALDIKTEIQFFDALTMKPISERLLLEPGVKTAQLEAGGNQAVSWQIRIPDGLQAVTYRVTATSDRFSDGEESVIPVLTNRMLVTESLPLSVRGNQTRSYEFTKLLNDQSETLKNHSYTLEFTSNPAWSAILALPYFMEYPYDCVEQAFSRYYANSIAAHIVNSDPKIKRIFDIWRKYQPDALKSNLEKNEELKTLLLEETPWVREAKSESERRQRIAILFDLNRMAGEITAALRKVEQAQISNGGFAWFSGGRDDRYMTQHIVAGIGHLQKMGIASKGTSNMLTRAIAYMDARLVEDFEELKKAAAERGTDYREEDYLNNLAAHYLYARSFFIQSHPVPQNSREAFDYYKSQAAVYWTKRNNYLKGMFALALNRFGDQEPARQIMRSLTETALHSEEMGMYWAGGGNGWWWYEAPIETQALMIEAYNEILADRESVEELKIWLLKQKQTQDWKTTKATSEAIYALLNIGDNLLASDTLAEITVGGQTIDPNKLEEGSRPEAGTGYFKTSWKGEEIKPDMGNISVTNPNPTVAWGAAYWQYFEQLDKITPAETGVSIKKQLFVKSNTPNGPILREITSDAPINVGDKVTVRIEIRADRDMEYVHLKDMRAAAFEPVNVLSGYRRQDGLGYYESTRDAATNFFISYLSKGTYVFEYELFATQQGEFSNGITTLQCMYAPEFATHSEGIRIEVVP